MRIKPSTKIHSMLRIYPQLEEVLEDHDINVDDVGTLSVRRACLEYELDVDDVVGDLKASLRDSATEGWLDVEDDAVSEDSDDDYDEEDDYYEESGGGLLSEAAAGADAGTAEDEDESWD